MNTILIVTALLSHYNYDTGKKVDLKWEFDTPSVCQMVARGVVNQENFEYTIDGKTYSGTIQSAACVAK